MPPRELAKAKLGRPKGRRISPPLASTALLYEIRDLLVRLVSAVEAQNKKGR